MLWFYLMFWSNFKAKSCDMIDIVFSYPPDVFECQKCFIKSEKFWKFLCLWVVAEPRLSWKWYFCMESPLNNIIYFSMFFYHTKLLFIYENNVGRWTTEHRLAYKFGRKSKFSYFFSLKFYFCIESTANEHFLMFWIW